MMAGRKSLQFCWQYINAYQLVLVICTCGKQSRRFKLLPLRATVCRVNTVYNFKGCATVLQREFARGWGGRSPVLREAGGAVVGK